MADAPEGRSQPRGLIVAAASSHSGKTVVTLGLIAALRRRGLDVAAAKCGPDYIDAAFLAHAAGGRVVNLDAWAMSAARLRGLAGAHGAGADLLIVEGVMGLMDGATGGAGSTAQLARALELPAVLVISGQGLAQSAAAVADGFDRLSQGVGIAGAIVNRVASVRHAELVREGFGQTTVPLIGAVGRDPALALASRHLGLVQAAEAPATALAAVIAAAADAVEAGVDLDAIVSAARPLGSATGGAGLPPPGQRIAIACDIAFGFAYAHVLEGWRAAGAELSFFSPLADEAPPHGSDFIYLPGGYPELQGGVLAAAEGFREGLAAAAERGTPIYGECGGFMVLGEALVGADGTAHRMAGLLPLVTSFENPRLTLGYRRLEPLADLPWPRRLGAHEFHYARVVTDGTCPRLFQAATSEGVALGAIGLRKGSVMGSFAHVIDPLPADPLSRPGDRPRGSSGGPLGSG